MNSAAQTNGAKNMTTYTKISERNVYHAIKAGGTELMTSDLWEAVKHCDPELKHNSMEDAETNKPVSPMTFKTAGNGSTLAVCITTRKKYARKDDRVVLGTVTVYVVTDYAVAS